MIWCYWYGTRRIIIISNSPYTLILIEFVSLYAKTFVTYICWLSIFAIASGGNMFDFHNNIYNRINRFFIQCTKYKTHKLRNYDFFVNKYQWKQHTVTSNPVVNYPITLGYWLIIVHVEFFFQSNFPHVQSLLGTVRLLLWTNFLSCTFILNCTINHFEHFFSNCFDKKKTLNLLLFVRLWGSTQFEEKWLFSNESEISKSWLLFQYTPPQKLFWCFCRLD